MAMAALLVSAFSPSFYTVPFAFALIVTLILTLLKLHVWSKQQSKNPKVPPGPWPLPLFGSLHLLSRDAIPYRAFLKIATRFQSDIIQLTLGSTNCVVVNRFDHMKDVLLCRSTAFGGRPNFLRYHVLFGGNRDNSLALCDWSHLQKTRRGIVNNFTHPKPSSDMYDNLRHVIASETDAFVDELKRTAGKPTKPKIPLLVTCANIFTHYMCSKRFSYKDEGFVQMVKDFDCIFYDINQGYAVDFMPWLAPFYQQHFSSLQRWSKRIRSFMMAEVIADHEELLDANAPKDFVDILLLHLKDENEKVLDWNAALYELEDMIGGHSALGNLWMRIAALLIQNPECQRGIHEEIDRVTEGNSRAVTLDDKGDMPYTVATMMETLRHISSPIVPHVATEDTELAGYFIQKDTVIFLNNYVLNTSPDLWTNPDKFDPSRFVRDGQFVKPEYFIPFSTGKRACMGHQLVQTVIFMLVARICQEFTLSVPPLDKSIENLQPACLALPTETFCISFTPRKTQTPTSNDEKKY